MSNKKYSWSDFLNDEIAINVKTEEEAKDFVNKAKLSGINCGITDAQGFSLFKENTVYLINHTVREIDKVFFEKLLGSFKAVMMVADGSLIKHQHVKIIPYCDFDTTVHTPLGDFLEQTKGVKK